MLEYHHLKTHPKFQDIWKKSYENEIGRLAQGMPGRVTGTNTMFFIGKTTFQQTDSETSHTAELYATIQKAKQNQTGKDSLWVETRETTLEIVAHQPQTYSPSNYS